MRTTKKIRDLFFLMIVTTGVISSFADCYTDQDYHFFINPVDPISYDIQVAYTPGSTVADMESDSNGLSLVITALDADGSVNTHYTRTAYLSLIDSKSPSAAISPGISPNFSKGTATIPLVLLKSIGQNGFRIHGRDEKHSSIEGISDLISLAEEPDHFNVVADYSNLTINDLESGSSNLTLTITALNADGSRNILYNRTTDLSVICGSCTSPVISPNSTASFVNGQLVLTGIAVSGVREDFQIRAEDDRFSDIEGISNTISLEGEPACYEVTLSGGTVSLCAIDSPTGNPQILTIRALDSTGTLVTGYNRYANLTFENEGSSGAAFSHTQTPNFTNGVVTMTNISISGYTGDRFRIRAVDERYTDIEGVSAYTALDVRRADHFTITIQGSPAIIESGGTYPLTILAWDQTNARYTDYNGYVNLSISNGTLNVSTVRLINGYARYNVKITTSGSFTITATVNATQPVGTICLGGLSAGEGAGSVSSETARATTISCSLYVPYATQLKKGINFNLHLKMKVYNQDGGNMVVGIFTGTAAYSSSPGAMTPASTSFSQTLSWYYTNQYASSTYFRQPQVFRIDGSGDGSVSAHVTMTSDPSITCDCSTNVTVQEGIGVFGDYSQQLMTTYLEAHPELASKKFIRITSISSIDDLNAYNGLIVNFTGTGWYSGRELSSASAAAIREFYDSGRPVLIAHDAMNDTVLTDLADYIWGVSGRTQMEIAQVTFSLIGSHDILTVAPYTITGVNTYGEHYSDGFLHDSGISDSIVSTTFNSTGYACMLATQDPATRGILLNESIVHPFAGENSTETQWWVTNKELMVNAINWLFP
ncbi:MAG: hypothetical protein GY754_43900 [bacterium]|nr:hypothetical protein [bacterium]